MSAASRKNDPFNFDDIYRQAGVEDLFVKKTLGELKQQKPAPGPMPAASPARPAPAAQQPKPAQNVTNIDLDFLSSIATPGGTPPHLSKPNSAANLQSVGGPQAARQQAAVPSPVPSSKPVDDPFALFEEVPGAAPAQRHAPPPPPPAAPPMNGVGDLLGFDDGHAFPQPAPAPAPTVAERTAAPSSGTPSAPTTATLLPLSQSLSQSGSWAEVPGPAPRQQQQQQQQQQTPADAAPPPPPDYASHADHRAAPPGPQRPSYPSIPPASSPSPASAHGGAPPPPYARVSDGARVDPHAPPSFSSPYTAHRESALRPGPGHPTHPTHTAAPVPFEPEPTNSSSPSFSWGQAPAGSGLSGMLKAFGKKAVRVAKAGLVQLEHALEGLEQQQQGGSQQGHGQGHGHGTGPSVSGRSSGGAGGRSYADGVPPSNDEALAWAVRLADLPPHAQEQELSHMAPALRRKVIEVLREQIRSEHEAAAMGQAPPHPYPSPAATGPPGRTPSTGAGHGHGPAPSPRRDAADGPSPLGHGHGGGAPGAPPPYRRGGSQDGGVGHPSARAGREMPPGAAAAAAPPPPSYGDAGNHATAPSAPPPPPPAIPDTHDLLGMGGAPSAVPAAPAPAPLPAAPAAGPAGGAPQQTSVVVDDLLGFEDGPRPATAVPRASASTVPVAPSPPPLARSPSSVAAGAAVAPAAAPPPPPPPPPPAAVHVDDMDDFFSGGAAAAPPPPPPPVAPAGRAASGSMHVSSSAPHLGGGRVGASGSSSAAALGDMLLHEEDGGGLGGMLGGGADVDVSGYEDLYRGEQGQADEPELRKRLRAQREAAKHAKMKAALAEKLAMEAEEAARREQQVALKDQYKTDIEVWKNRHKGNIRGLLGSLHTVLWPDSGWAPVSVGDLLEPAQIKKVYMKANLLVHPDKVRQRNGSAEQVAIADMVFDVLKDAWNAFR